MSVWSSVTATLSRTPSTPKSSQNRLRCTGTYVSKADNDPSLTSRMHYLSHRGQGPGGSFCPCPCLSLHYFQPCFCRSPPGTPHAQRRSSAEPTNPNRPLPHAYPQAGAWPGFEGQFVRLKEVLRSTELVGPSAPWHMPNWTLFRRPATAVHKSDLRSFPRRHIAWMSNITNTFTRVDRNTIGNPNIIPATPSLHSMITSIMDALLPHIHCSIRM
ncbi:hypothetical protein V8E53_010299 [Lactarius tabidus]